MGYAVKYGSCDGSTDGIRTPVTDIFPNWAVMSKVGL